MRKLLLGGIWVCAVTSASVYIASLSAGGAAPVAEPHLQGLDYVKTRQITVPRISQGKIQGYVVARFVFTVKAQTLQHLSVPPEVFVVDEAFQVIYRDERLDFENLQKVDLAEMAKAITENVNARLQPELVQETLVEQFDYIPYHALATGFRPAG